MQLAAGGGGQHQGRIVEAEAHTLQRATLRVEGDGRLTERIVDRPDDGLDVVRIGDLVVVLQHQCLAVGQAQRHAAATRLVLDHRGDGHAGRQRQAGAIQRLAVLQFEELHLAGPIQAHGHLILLLNGEQQRLVLLRQPGRLLRITRLQLGTAEDRQHDAGQIEEDQGNRAKDGETANGHVPTRQVVLERAHATLALERRRIEIQSLRF
ncbi:hypothetical protein D3C81_1587750 [compost metagenome]